MHLHCLFVLYLFVQKVSSIVFLIVYVFVFVLSCICIVFVYQWCCRMIRGPVQSFTIRQLFPWSALGWDHLPIRLKPRAVSFVQLFHWEN